MANKGLTVSDALLKNGFRIDYAVPVSAGTAFIFYSEAII